MQHYRRQAAKKWPRRVTFTLIAVAILLSAIASIDWSGEYSGFFMLGILGAITANATGAGGGVVFVPSFRLLGLPSDVIIATSFAIQSCGMAVGSLSWLWFYRRQNSLLQLAHVLKVSVPFSILGLWLVQYMPIQSATSVDNIFNVFSAIFGVVVLCHCMLVKPCTYQNERHKLLQGEQVTIAVCSFLGGMITAWISVGVGEILAVVLLLQGFSIMFSVAAGVIVSCLTVWAGLPYFLSGTAIHVDILMFAIPGAVVGAFLARFIAQALGAKPLKLFLGSWILFVGLYGLLN